MFYTPTSIGRGQGRREAERESKGKEEGVQDTIRYGSSVWETESTAQMEAREFYGGSDREIA